MKVVLLQKTLLYNEDQKHLPQQFSVEQGNWFNAAAMYEHAGQMTFWFIWGFQITVFAQLVLYGKAEKDVDDRIELMKLKIKS